MTRLALTAAISLVLAGCGGSREEISTDFGDAPADQHNICSVFEQRPGWREAVWASASKWGAPVPVQMAIIWRESSFRPKARPLAEDESGNLRKLSSAYGFAQAIDGTWDWYREATGNSAADRTRFEDAADFVGWYMARTATDNRVGMHDAFNHYLAYHEGHAGHRRGSYQEKTWLIAVAERVAAQAARYRGQYRSC